MPAVRLHFVSLCFSLWSFCVRLLALCLLGANLCAARSVLCLCCHFVSISGHSASICHRFGSLCRSFCGYLYLFSWLVVSLCVFIVLSIRPSSLSVSLWLISVSFVAALRVLCCLFFCLFVFIVCLLLCLLHFYKKY